MNDLIEIGQVAKPQGLKGFIKINPFTDDMQKFENYKRVFIKNIEYKIEDLRYNKNQVIIKLKGIDTVEEAEKLRNLYLYIDKSDLAELPEDSYYIVDLIGLEVFNEENNELLGKIEDVFPTGSNDVYVVRSEIGKQILLPAIKDVIKDVNIKDKKMIVKLLKGLEDEV